MAWTIEYTDTARKRIRKLPPATFWRYRVGDYRIVCDIVDKRVSVLVVTVGHRKEIYR